MTKYLKRPKLFSLFSTTGTNKIKIDCAVNSKITPSFKEAGCIVFDKLPQKKSHVSLVENAVLESSFYASKDKVSSDYHMLKPAIFMNFDKYEKVNQIFFDQIIKLPLFSICLTIYVDLNFRNPRPDSDSRTNLKQYEPIVKSIVKSPFLLQMKINLSTKVVWLSPSIREQIYQKIDN
jgi:hypothetical protein